MLDKLDYSLVPNDFALCLTGNAYMLPPVCVIRCRGISRKNVGRWERSTRNVLSPMAIVPGLWTTARWKMPMAWSTCWTISLIVRLKKYGGRWVRIFRDDSIFTVWNVRSGCFTPEDQLYVRDLLRQYNIEEEPLFDRYEENFGWERCSDTIAWKRNFHRMKINFP